MFPEFCVFMPGGVLWWCFFADAGEVSRRVSLKDVALGVPVCGCWKGVAEGVGGGCRCGGEVSLRVSLEGVAVGAACLLMLQRALLKGVAVVVPVHGCWKGFVLACGKDN